MRVMRLGSVQRPDAARATYEGIDMRFRKSLLVGLCAASLGGVMAPMTANAAVEVYLNTAPPPLRVEAVPAPRHGYIWVPGYWDARGHSHYWRAGHWERERHGYTYVEPRWVERDNRWYLERGRWARGDADHDGIRNSADHAPYNPNRG